MTAPADASAVPMPEDPPTPEFLLPDRAPQDRPSAGGTSASAAAAVDRAPVEDDDDSEPDDAPPPVPPAHVTAVIVASDGARWLPRALGQLARQTRPPDAVVAVDTGSSDASRQLLVEAFGDESLLDLPRGTAFGAAVAAALARRPPGRPSAEPPRLDAAARATDAPDGDAPDGDAADGDAAVVTGAAVADWVWLLHDDCAPADDALERLLVGAAADSGVAVAGPKVRGWRNRRMLLEIGVTVGGSGRRDTGLEHREQDQGQHDGQRRVLAVGTAGMLVRRAVLDDVGGFDPLLPAFGDDLDLCWRVRRAGHEVVCVTDAVVHHVAAAANGRRPVHAAGRHAQRAHLLERRSAMYVVAANRPSWQLPFVLLRLVAGALGRAAMYLVGKVPSYAADEVRAAGWLLAHVGALRAAQRDRRRTAAVPHADVAPLLARPGSQVRAGAETVAAAVAQRMAAITGTDARPGRRSSVLETGPAAEESEDLDAGGSGVLRAQLRRPGVLLTLALLVLGAIASRSLVGAERLSGGALLPAHGSAADLWRQYVSSWRPVGTGSAESSPPYLAVVAALSTPVGGSARLVVDLLLLGCVPLAGISAYACARRLTTSPLLRVWGAAAYALLPACTGAVASGRIGTAGAVVLLPPLALALGRALLSDDDASARRSAWAGAVLLALTTALVPLAWPVAAVVALVIAVSTRRRGPLLRAAVVAAVPGLVLAPWSWQLLREPRLLALEAGMLTRDVVDAEVPPYAVLLLHPGGPGMYPVVLSAGIVAAGLAGLLRTQRRPVVLGAWVAVVVATVAGLLLARIQVTGVAGVQLPPWPGFATAVAGLGLLVAAVVAGDRAVERLGSHGFGWRQPVAAAVALVAAAAPVFAAAAWAVRGAGDPLERRSGDVVPAFVAAAAESPARQRTLVLDPTDDGRIHYTLLRNAGPRLGDAEVVETPAAREVLDRVVADLTSGRGGTDVGTLATFGTGFVLLLTEPSDTLVGDLDAVPGLERVGAPGRGVLWRLTGETGRARVVSPASTIVVPSGPVEMDTDVPPGTAERTLQLAESADPRWRATLDGRPLPATTVAGWAQGFGLPAEGGRLLVEHRDPWRAGWLAVAALTLVAALVLALPALRVAGDAGDDEEGAA